MAPGILVQGNLGVAGMAGDQATQPAHKLSQPRRREGDTLQDLLTIQKNSVFTCRWPAISALLGHMLHPLVALF
jgi:hypothetical protein